ncbi:hypothetical protein QE390_000690 [Siphonobacter sp. SORGH_AS 1065]|nr:hypothetical protein [Siphonobacter sp. SORGH_AS_1065]
MDALHEECYHFSCEHIRKEILTIVKIDFGKASYEVVLISNTLGIDEGYCTHRSSPPEWPFYAHQMRW